MARKRRRLTAKNLAETAGVAPLTITRLEKGENVPDDETVAKLAAALKYPVAFFFKDQPETVDLDAVSFRCLSKMSAKERDAALAASELGIELVAWIEERFNFPTENLLDLSIETDGAEAARQLRHYWSLGLRPIGDLTSLLEHNGIRVLSLSEDTASVDAFSFWRDDVPYVFLNNFKSAERSRFDAAHELGHLVMHRHAGRQHSKSAEREADEFAANFLMPPDDVRARMPRLVTVQTILDAKRRWRVSAFALTVHLYRLELISKHTYSSLCIELTKRGYRTAEKDGIARETSHTWRAILTALWEERITKRTIADNLSIPPDELEGLIWNLAGIQPADVGNIPLRLVTSTGPAA